MSQLLAVPPSRVPLLQPTVLPRGSWADPAGMMANDNKSARKYPCGRLSFGCLCAADTGTQPLAEAVRVLCCAAVLWGLVGATWWALQAICACSYSLNHSVTAPPLVLLHTGSKEICCEACEAHPGCGMATFFAGETNTSVEAGQGRATCTIQSTRSDVQCDCALSNSSSGIASHATALTCAMPSSTGQDAAARHIEFGLATAPAWLRGAFVTAFISLMCRRLSGAQDSTLIAGLIGIRETEPVGWDQIVGESNFMNNPFRAGSVLPPGEPRCPPMRWNDAHAALGLTRKQALFIAAVKLFAWHLSQPVAFMLALFAFGCQLSLHQRGIASYVAAREIVYAVAVVLACVKCPSFLLLSPRSTWEASAPLWKRLAQLATFIFTPHHYVTLCLWCSGVLGSNVARLVLLFQVKSS